MSHIYFHRFILPDEVQGHRRESWWQSPDPRGGGGRGMEVWIVLGWLSTFHHQVTWGPFLGSWWLLITPGTASSLIPEGNGLPGCGLAPLELGPEGFSGGTQGSWTQRGAPRLVSQVEWVLVLGPSSGFPSSLAYLFLVHAKQICTHISLTFR